MADRVAKPEYVEWALRDLGLRPLDGLSKDDHRMVMWTACVREDHQEQFAPEAIDHGQGISHGQDKGCGCPVNSDCIHDSILIQ